MFLFRIISYLPLNILYLFSDFIYLLACYVFKYRAKIIDDNLLHAFPEKTTKERAYIKKKFYRNFTDSLAETIKFLTITKEGLAERMTLINADLVTDRVRRGETVIGICGHFFNWEANLLAFTSSLHDKCEVVYLKVNNPFFENFMYAMRSRFGGNLVERSQFQRNFIKKRNEPRLIVLAADQRPHHADIRYWATFMNRETAFFEGAEKLAKKFNNPVIFGTAHKPKRGHYVFTYQLLAEPPHDQQPHSITDRFIELTEQNIREEPALYLWSHNRWKEQRLK
ncbi:lysophospholipid acyltransferase family protein [Anditalea andensis]|uniref:Lipid A biosynthesis acyltransferase n=1 Tax=Anditalea andensis TaxID=1048983 RepID=A0A074L1N8_9BACT|nr:lysophospholipid acyltransferase family protein [Anditalea andensis]KEO75074.1 lipid A biosynthesis acyltransferase [Anditalea andensis]